MYCRFCGSSIPNERSFCPVCGKAQFDAADMQQAAPLQEPEHVITEEKKMKKEKKRKRGLVIPSLFILISVVTWILFLSMDWYGEIGNAIDILKTANQTPQNAGGLDVDSVGQVITDQFTDILLAIALGTILILVTILGIIGLVKLIRRIGYRIADKKD